MRIIAGKWRGRTIEAPPGSGTRPILDRAKTVLFDILGSRLDEPGRLPAIAVLDLFAGSGALGLEALSRGAGYCLLIEQHRRTAALLRHNLDTLGIVAEARVVEGDAATVPFTAPPSGAGGAGHYELVFVDPPYRLLEQNVPDPSIRRLLERLACDPAISPTALIVVRHGRRPASAGPDLSPLIERERRDVGTMTFRLMGVAPERDDAV